MSGYKGFHSFGAFDGGFGAKSAQRSTTHASHREGSGEQRFGQALTGSLAEYVVEHQGTHATVHQPGRPLIGPVEGEVTPALGAILAMVDGERRGDRVAQAEHRVAPDHGPNAHRGANQLR